MTVQFNVTGSERKKLVTAISKVLDAEVNYQGAPTFAYEIGEYRIDKTGTVTGPDNRDLITALAEPHGFVAIIGEYDDVASDIDQHHPGQYADPDVPPTEEMLRQAETWMEEQPDFEDLHLTEREELGFGRERRDPVGEDGPQPSDVPEQDAVVIEMPLEGFTTENIDNLCKLVASKEVLIKKALGTAELPIQVLEGRIAFPWFKAITDDGCVDAYAQLITALCKTAKEKKRVTAKAQESFENEKFAMRVWLIGLGLIGKDYSLARKLLMANLDGNSGFRYGAPEQRDAASNVRSGGESRAKKLTVPLNETAEQKAKRELIQLWANTDKRREFLQNHRGWGVWITTPELGLTYYRYELPDGGRILAMEYQRENPYTLSGEESLQTVTTYFLWDGEHFTPHSASEYTIIDRLKNLKAVLQKELCAAAGEEPAPAATTDTTLAEESATAQTEAETGEDSAPAPTDAAPVEDEEAQGDE